MSASEVLLPTIARLIGETEADQRTRTSRTYRWRMRRRARNPMPFVRVGGRVMYDPLALEKWILTDGRCAQRLWTRDQKRSRRSVKRRSGSPSTARAQG